MDGLKTTITLQRPFPGADGMITEVIVREPTGGEVFSLGVPGQWIRSKDGAIAYIENNDTIRAYAERCIVKPDPLLVLGKASVIDALAIRDAIVGFFLETPTASTT